VEKNTAEPSTMGAEAASGRIDVHAHYLPTTQQRAALASAPPIYRGFVNWDIPPALEMMDRQGIAAAILHPTAPACVDCTSLGIPLPDRVRLRHDPWGDPPSPERHARTLSESSSDRPTCRRHAAVPGGQNWSARNALCAHWGACAPAATSAHLKRLLRVGHFGQPARNWLSGPARTYFADLVRQRLASPD